MATHSSILAWRISWTEEPGELKSMWSLRAGYNLTQHASTISRKKEKENNKVNSRVLTIVQNYFMG